MSNPIIAILGKPNVGKSTLFNRIIGKRESIVSSEEGVTRDRIYGNFDWQGKEFTLIDTGGYIPDSTEIIDNHVRIQAEVASKEADIIILLIDGRSNITSSDQYLAKQVQKSGKPYVLAINKISSGNHISRIMNDVNLIRDGIERSINNLVRDTLTIIVLVCYLISF